ncbi:hypothetical protein [Kordia sp. SMS9]|uniref:hypothetical protein n=1 Tax=Kordia sp. SMS9 TaxID=2282170 RepID=UPI000E0D56C8|nr:hypothetical protein [Kordia sp. SMS9]
MNNKFLQISTAHKDLSINLSIDPKPWYDPAFIVVNSYNKLILNILEDTFLIPKTAQKTPLQPRILAEKAVRKVNNIPIWEVTIGLGDVLENEQSDIGTYFMGETNHVKKRGLKLSFTGESIRKLSDWGGIHVRFIYNSANEETRFGACYFIVTKEKNKYGSLNIDLGSEATQMAYIPPNEETASNASEEPSNISIIDEIKKGYTNLNVGDQKTAYIQRDQHKEDSYLYKTGKIIYKKKGDLSSHYDDPSCVMALLSDRTFLDQERLANRNGSNQMLWQWKTHERNYDVASSAINERELYVENIQDNLTMIGNLKLAYLDPKQTATIQLNGKLGNTRRRGNLIALTSYIYKTLIDIGTREMKTGKDVLFMRLLLLMPNIYDQDRVNTILRSLNETFNKEFMQQYFSEDGDTETLQNPVVVETFAISESDASLIGYLSNNSLWIDNERIDMGTTDDERFLIIDAGKGTIDYSILDYNGKGLYNCVDRGGMAGAGQYLTNIFLKAMGSLFTEQYGNPEKYCLFVQKVDMVQALVLEEFFERLKINYSIENARDIEKETFFQQFLKHIQNDDTRAAIRILQNSFDYLDQKNAWNFTLKRCKAFIAEKSNHLVQTFINNLIIGNPTELITDIKYIVLSGRAMNFDPFRKQLETELQSKVKHKNIKKMFRKTNEYTSVVFPDLLGAMDLKKKAINLEAITNFSVNSNSNLLITFDNESESNSLFTGVEIDEKQLHRFNYRYEPETNLSERKQEEEITHIYYLGMQSDAAFLLESSNHKLYKAIPKLNKDYNVIGNFLEETLFGPGKSLANSEMYAQFLKDMSHLGTQTILPKTQEHLRQIPKVSTRKEPKDVESLLETVEVSNDYKKSASELLGN